MTARKAEPKKATRSKGRAKLTLSKETLKDLSAREGKVKGGNKGFGSYAGCSY